MNTPNQIIMLALSKLGISGGLKLPRAEDTALGLTVLQALYRNMITSGQLGRSRSKVVSTGPYIANENEKILRTDGCEITLPQEVKINYPNVSQDDYNCGDYGYDYDLPVFGCSTRLPKNGAFVIINDSASGASAEFIYDGYINQWVSIHDLDLTDNSIAPLSTNLNNLAARLAVDLADYFGATLQPATVKSASMYDQSLINGFGDGDYPVPGHFF